MAGPVRARPPVPRQRCRGIARVIAVLAMLACGSALPYAPAFAQQVFTLPASRATKAQIRHRHRA